MTIACVPVGDIRGCVFEQQNVGIAPIHFLFSPMKMSRIEIETEQNRLVMLQPAVQELLQKYPHVDHVGVGVKETRGWMTGELCFRVYVHEKVNAEKLGRRWTIPSHIMGAKTDVLEKHAVLQQAADFANYRPLRGGICIGNELNSNIFLSFLGYGTMGCLARKADASNKLVGLSAQHVLTNGFVPVGPVGPLTPIGLRIGQPTTASVFGIVTNVVGKISQLSSAALDCGIFEIETDEATFISNAGSEYMVQGFNNLTGVAQAVCYEVVRKRGAATGITSGVVVDVKFEGTKILINPCTDFVNFSEPGDSGAVIVNSANKVVGLLIGGSRTNPTKGVAQHIKPVLTELNITIAGQGASTPGLVGVPVANCTPGGVTVCVGGLPPTIAESRNYFKALDDGTLFIHLEPGYAAETLVTQPLHQRQEDIFTRVVPPLAARVFSDPNGWKNRAKSNNVAEPLIVLNAADPARPTAIVDAALRAAIVRLSDYQLGLLATHFPGPVTGEIDYDKTRVTFERFMNGELRERPLTPGSHPKGTDARDGVAWVLKDGPREPNGSFEMMFSGFAWLCIENNIDRAKWIPIYNICVQCQELFMVVYRWRPQVAPPLGSIPIPAFTASTTPNDLEPVGVPIGGGRSRRVRVGETGFGNQGFSFDHFNLGPGTDTLAMVNARLDGTTSIAQSGAARKLFLRNKYAALDYNATKNAMKENIQRMLYMP